MTVVFLNALRTVAAIAMLFCIVSGAFALGPDVQIWASVMGAGFGLILAIFLARRG